MKNRFKRISRTQIIAIGYLIMILLGTGLLLLPFASRQPGSVTFTDAFFTATSASCVTGLILHDTYTYWTLFGQIVIITLIQIGGLGFMTMATLFFTFMKKNMGLGQRELMVESINANSVAGIMPLTKMIVKYTAIFELSGAVLLSTQFIPDFGWLRGIYYGLFHSISAFCNAGFDLLGIREPLSSFISYYNNIVINITLFLLITIGGLGFLVWKDIGEKRFKVKRYTLHTKIVLITSAILTFGGAIIFYILELRYSGASMTVGNRMITALFNSVTARTAGFCTVDPVNMGGGSKLFMCFLMLIGGSSGSTAGGIKTTTIAVIAIYAVSSIRHNQCTFVFKRSLDDGVLKKAVSIISMSFSLGFVGAILISAMHDFPIIDVVFETFSAIGTVGITAGLTGQLCMAARYIIIFLMYCGRVGSTSFAGALLEKRAMPAVTYPTEQITIG